MALSPALISISIRRAFCHLFPSFFLFRKQCASWGRFLEKEYFFKARSEGYEDVEWEVDSLQQSLQSSSGPEILAAPNVDLITQFIISLGLRRIRFDIRLESNQVEDIFVSLYAARSSLAPGKKRKLKRLLLGEGLKMYCAEVHILEAENTLSLKYSYCQLLFSRAVTTFKKKSSIFKDHRSFFYAAPRYGAVIGLSVLLVPLILHLFLPGYEILILAVVGLFIGSLTYLLFQTIGSIEYDKEEQASEIFRAHRTLQEKQWLIDQDLEKAAMIQKKILPGEFFRIRGLEIAARLKPQSQVGGDFYDVWETREGDVVVILVDSVGHGLFSALIATAIESVFLNIQKGPPLHPKELIASVRMVLERILPLGFFAAMTYLHLKPEKKEGIILNAGNPFPLLIHADGTEECLKEASAVPLGIPSSLEYYEPWTFSLTKGEKIILYTDGIIEARNMQGEDYTEKRLRHLIRENHQATPAELRELVFRDQEVFAQGLAPSDDQTLLVVGA